MKAIRYLFLTALFGLGVLVTNGPAFAWTDTSMPHFSKDANCSDHLIDPTHVGNPPRTVSMKMCPLNSGATTWSATIVKIAIPPVNVCTFPSTSVANSTFNCTLNTAGSYKGTITYCVGGSCFVGHADYRWTVP